MSEWYIDRFRMALRWGDDREARELAKEIWDRSFSKHEAAEKIAEAMREERPFDTREFGNEVTYDGITVRRGYFPRLDVEEKEVSG